MAIKKISMSFSGGEVTPEFWGQVTDAKFQSGLASMRNFIALPHGPAVNRPGFAYVNMVKDSSFYCRLIPFTYSTTQTMVLEFGQKYIRFHTQGATLLSGSSPYEVATPYLSNDLSGIRYVQSADVLTLVHPSYPPMELRRLGATNWTLTPISFVSSLTPPSSVGAVATQAASPTNLTTYGYVVTSVSATGLEESAASSQAVGKTITITSVTQANPGVFSTSGAHGLVPGQTVTITGILGMTQANGTYQVVSTPTATTFTVGVVTSSFIGTVVTPLDTTTFGAYTSGGTIGSSAIVNNLLQTGAYNTISWSSTGAPYYNVYKLSNGLYGYIGRTNGLTFKDDNITADLSKTPPVITNPFSGPGYYPGAVSYFQQRRCFAGSIYEPQNLRMTRSGTESNLAYSIPSRDDDAINVRVAAREANTIQHIVPLASLVLLTGAAEWRVNSLNSDVLTPTSIGVSPQSYVGAANAQPVVVNNNIIYSAARGGHMREMAYSFQSGGYVTGDLSLRAPHLFDGYSIIDMGFSKAPWPILWAVSSSGNLLGLTYVPEQQIGAWHVHDTGGSTGSRFESCCVVAEGAEDVLYVIVARYIAGGVRRYVERMSSRISGNTLASAFYVDSGSTYSGTPTTVISGLGYLEGCTVAVLGDGAVLPQQVVTGGKITLPQAVSQAVVGLPITAEIKTLPLYAQIDGGAGMGKLKNINKAWIRTVKTSGLAAGPDASHLIEYKQRTTETYGTPPALKDGVQEITLEPSWQDEGQIVVHQSNPLPATIVALTLECEVGG